MLRNKTIRASPEAYEQSVTGLVTAGLERVRDVVVPKDWTLQFIGSTLQIEQRNKAMNAFVAQLIAKMRAAGDLYVTSERARHCAMLRKTIVESVW